MGNTKIQWAEKTWNWMTGCDKISPACANCYAERTASGRLRGRAGYPADNPFAVTFRTDRLDEPTRWPKHCDVFVCSMGDMFHEQVEPQHRLLATSVMLRTPRHNYIMLTKRVERMVKVMRGYAVQRNWFLGWSAWDQDSFDEGFGMMSDLAVDGWPIWCSIEPMLGSIVIPTIALEKTTTVYGNPVVRDPRQFRLDTDCCTELERAAHKKALEDWDAGIKNNNWGGYGVSMLPNKTRLSGIVCGGETGRLANVRTMRRDWPRSLRDQCGQHGVPFMFKQWGPSRASGRLLYGVEHNETAWGNAGEIVPGCDK